MLQDCKYFEQYELVRKCESKNNGCGTAKKLTARAFFSHFLVLNFLKVLLYYLSATKIAILNIKCCLTNTEDLD